MKYERKSPYADGFNDIYTTAGVDVDDYWGRKLLLLGGDGGADGSSNMDDANINDVGLSLGGFGTVAEATAAQDAAAAEAAAQDAAQGEHDAYAAQVALGPGAQAFNFVSPIDITKTHDEFGRGVVGLDVSIPGVVGALSAVRWGWPLVLWAQPWAVVLVLIRMYLLGHKEYPRARLPREPLSPL